MFEKLRKKVWKKVVVIIFCLFFVFIFTVSAVVESATKDQLYADINKIPKNKVGLLLGTSKYLDKSRKLVNPYYQNRIDAAVALYMAGKIDYIIVSGDNSTRYYNEPVQMKDDLIARGVPTEKIYMDNAGFRTLDSILRCRDIFGQEQFTIISQSFHNYRAVYIANHKHLKTVAYNAGDGNSFWEELLREKLARVKMLFDLMLNKGAKMYGDKIEIK